MAIKLIPKDERVILKGTWILKRNLLWEIQSHNANYVTQFYSNICIFDEYGRIKEVNIIKDTQE